MDLSEVNSKSEQVKLDVLSTFGGSRTEYFFSGVGLRKADAEQVDDANRLFACLSIDDLINQNVNEKNRAQCLENDFSFYGTSWQSWGYGTEIDPGKKQKEYKAAIPQFKQYVNFPGTPVAKLGKIKSTNKRLLKGCFVIYLRWGTTYLAVCSTANASKSVAEGKEIYPPVKFYVDPKKRQIWCVVYADGKSWGAGEKIAELTVFSAENFFALRDSMKKLYAPNPSLRFGDLEFLSCSKDKILTGGWESWYNHYNHINQTLIEEDLDGLGTTENLIKKCFIDKGYKTVFQVDDGWEQGCGQWECDTNLFPGGMINLSNAIVNKGYIPGLWIAPFVIDWRTQFCKGHRDWILCDAKGKPIPAGFNFPWGDFMGKDQPGQPYSYFCFDLSIDEVLTYLDGLMDKVVNEWGFRYIKLDFLFAGMIKGKFKNGGSAYEWYNRAVKVLTKRKINKNGDRVAYLGCGLPLESSFNDFPLSRIGPDTKEAWDYKPMAIFDFYARPGALGSLKSCMGHSFFDQAIYINDPDVDFLRYENIKLDDKEKELLALTNYLFASQIMHSDDPVNFDQEKEGPFTEHIVSLFEKFENQEFGLLNVTDETAIIFSKSGEYAGFINISEKKATFTKDQITALVPSAKTYCNFNPVVEHAVRTGDSFTSEPHSISIYSL